MRAGPFPYPLHQAYAQPGSLSARGEVPRGGPCRGALAR